MGRKISPNDFRLGITTDYITCRYATKNCADYMVKDMKIRNYLTRSLERTGIPSIEIERRSKRITISLHAARPGIVIGRSGAEAERVRAGLRELTGKQAQLNILEVKNPKIDAQLITQGVAEQLGARVAFRCTMCKAQQMATHAGAKGIRIKYFGRLGGTEMSHFGGYHNGQVSLHILRVDIDYGFYEARTTFGRIGIRVWIYRGGATGTRAERAAQKAIRSPAPIGRQRSGRRPGRGEGRGDHPERGGHRRAEAT